MNWYVAVLKKYAAFDGRSGRPEYWYFTLFNAVAAIILVIFDGILGTYPLLVGLYILAVILPGLGVAIRRLHDTGRSGWWILIGLVPIVGGIVLIVFYAQAGAQGENAYGPAPA